MAAESSEEDTDTFSPNCKDEPYASKRIDSSSISSPPSLFSFGFLLLLWLFEKAVRLVLELLLELPFPIMVGADATTAGAARADSGADPFFCRTCLEAASADPTLVCELWSSPLLAEDSSRMGCILLIDATVLMTLVLPLNQQ